MEEDNSAITPVVLRVFGPGIHVEWPEDGDDGCLCEEDTGEIPEDGDN